MNSHQSLTLVSAITDWEVLRENLLASPCLHTDRPLQFIFKQGYSAAGLAYNEALEAARHDLVIFVHQDVYLPEQWLDQVMTSIVALETFDPHWGVLGCYGRSRDHALGIGRVYTTGCQWHGSRICSWFRWILSMKSSSSCDNPQDSASMVGYPFFISMVRICV